jgi:hypothetical protein
MANDLTVTNDNDLALLGEAASDLTAGDLVGVQLKYVQGVWKKKNTDDFINVTATQQFIVDMLSYQHGWVRWIEKKRTHRYMGRKVDHYPFPDRSQLPEKELIGSKEDPWQPTRRIVMRDLGGDDAPKPTHDGLCTYTTTSYHGGKALGRLLDAYVNQAREHPGMMPVVYLGSKKQRNTMGGMTDVPVYTIVDWKPFGPGASPPGRKIAVAPIPLQLTHDDADGDGGNDGDGDDFTKPTIMSNGKEVDFNDDCSF